MLCFLFLFVDSFLHFSHFLSLSFSHSLSHKLNVLTVLFFYTMNLYKEYCLSNKPNLKEDIRYILGLIMRNAKFHAGSVHRNRVIDLTVEQKFWRLFCMEAEVKYSVNFKRSSFSFSFFKI